MPSLVEKMQPWTQQTHSFIPTNLLRRSWSSSSANSSTPLTSASSTASLISTSGGSLSNCNGGSSADVTLKNESKNVTKSSSTRAGGGTGSTSFFGKICSATSSKINNSGSASSSSNNVCGGSRPKRKTPILSTCMSNWVKFDHDCQKPSHCTKCEDNQELSRKVLFTSGGGVLISTGNSGKGKHNQHRHSHSFFGGGASANSHNHSTNHHTHQHHNHHMTNGGMSLSEPCSPIERVAGGGSVVGNSSIGDSSHNNAFPGEVVSWENAKNSSFKIVINVPSLDINLFQNDNIQVEIVCNKNKMATGKDLETVQRNRTELKCTGWYWEGIDSEASMEILESTKPGSFIVRDSADPRFLYSLSIQTERGPTSVRLPYRNGKFSLDGDDKLGDRVPKFDSVIGLIEHYVNGGTKIGKQVSVWIDHEGNMHSTVKLTKPMRKDVGSLKHLARVAINKNNLLTNSNNSTPSSSTSSTKNINGTSTNSSFPQDISNVDKTIVSPSSCNPSSSSISLDPLGVMDSTTATSVPKLSPKRENSISPTSTTPLTVPVADLSKLPMSLQTYMLEYPYTL